MFTFALLLLVKISFPLVQPVKRLIRPMIMVQVRRLHWPYLITGQNMRGLREILIFNISFITESQGGNFASSNNNLWERKRETKISKYKNFLKRKSYHLNNLPVAVYYPESQIQIFLLFHHDLRSKTLFGLCWIDQYIIWGCWQPRKKKNKGIVNVGEH